MRVADEPSNAGKLGGRWWRADGTPLLESVEVGAVHAGASGARGRIRGWRNATSDDMNDLLEA